MTRILYALACVFFWSMASTLFAQTTYRITDGNFSACDGYFTDSGGDSTTYKAGENHVITICPGSGGGSHVQLAFISVELGAGDSLEFFDGNSVNATKLASSNEFPANKPFIIQATAANTTGCLTVRFRSDLTNQRGGWIADINCVQSCQTIQSGIASSTPAITPADTGYLNICPGNTVQLSGKGSYPQNGLRYQQADNTSNFAWDFGDGTKMSGKDVSHTYAESGGYVIQLTITDARGCKSTNYLSQRVRVAPPPVFMLGNDIPTQICVGDTLNLNASIDIPDPRFTVSIEPMEESFTRPSGVYSPLALPDGVGTAYETIAKVGDFSPGQILGSPSDLEAICVTMEHSWMRDLQISIVCPNGQSTILHQFAAKEGSEVFLGKPKDNDDTAPSPGTGLEYCWVEGGQRGNWITYANTNRPLTLPPGDFAPFQSFNNLVGCPLNGDWKLVAEDLWARDNGYIFSWQIKFKQDLYPTQEKFKTQTVSFEWENNNGDRIFQRRDSAAFVPTAAGNFQYVFSAVDNFGCKHDTSITVEVLPESHPDCFDCNKIIKQPTDTTICMGGAVALDVTSSLTPIQPILFRNSQSFTTSIISNYRQASPLVVSGLPFNTITNPNVQIISVCVNLSTQTTGDVDMTLRTPDGRTLDLSSDNGNNSNDYNNTCFKPTATRNITTGSGPFTGDFLPEQSFGNLLGASSNGTWRLEVVDDNNFNFDPITINSWSITFGVGSQNTYTWSPGTGLSCTNCPNPTARPTQTTTYVVTATDGNTCTVVADVKIGVVRDTRAPVVSCQITEEKEITYTWTFPDQLPAEVNPTINGVAQGWQGPVVGNRFVIRDLPDNAVVSLQVRGYGATGCQTAIGSSQCTYVPCALTVDSIRGTPVSCIGSADGAAEVFVSGGNGTYSYEWSDSLVQLTARAQRLRPGNYQVKVRDSNGCLARKNVQVSQPDSLMLFLSPSNVSCTGQRDGRIAPLVEGGAAPYRFAWSNATADSVATNLASGFYQVTVTDNKGCSKTDTVRLSEPALPILLALDQTAQGCAGTKNNTARVRVSGGNPNGYFFVWSNGQRDSLITGLDSVSYIVTVTDYNGCMAVDSIRVRDRPAIDPNMIQAIPTCSDTPNGSLAVNFIQGGSSSNVNDYTYRWSNGQTGNSITGLLGGVTYTVTATDASGCSGVSERLLETPKPITFAVDSIPTLCPDSRDGSLVVNNIAGGNGGYTIRWGAGANNQTTTTIAGLGAGTYRFTVTDSRGCSNTGQGQITSPTPMNLTPNTTDNTCNGDRKGGIQLQVSGGKPAYVYQWADGTFGSIRNGLAAGNYSVSVSDANRCQVSATIEVKQPAPLQGTIDKRDIKCFGDKNGVITVTPQGGKAPYQYSLDGTSYSSVNTFNALGAGRYTILVRDGGGCISLLNEVSIAEPGQIVINLPQDPITIVLGDSIDLDGTAQNGTGRITYTWTEPYDGTLSCKDCPIPNARPQFDITYKVRAQDANGCFTEVRVVIDVDKPRIIEVPTAFTPNEDRTNDQLRVHGHPSTRIQVFQVFDRWGGLVFEQRDFVLGQTELGWDGLFKGNPAPSGVYVWKLKAAFPDGFEKGYSGETTLIR